MTQEFINKIKSEKEKKGINPENTPKKRGRGRPPKDNKPSQATSTGQTVTAQATTEPQKEFINIKPLIAGIIKAPFRAWAEATQIKDIELPNDTAEALGGQIEQLIEYYFPKEIPPIYLVWLSLSTTLGGAVISRVRLVEEKKKKELPPKVQDQPPIIQDAA